MPVTRDWLLQKRACGPEYVIFRREFGNEAAVTRENFERARTLGLNLLWLGCHMLDAEARRAFVDRTLTARRAALEALLGRAAPADSARLAAEGTKAFEAWAGSGDIGLRSLATAMHDAARDAAAVGPSAEDAYEAALGALRAISYAGEDQAGARLALEEWLANEVIGGAG
jgi:hypothetical protein